VRLLLVLALALFAAVASASPAAAHLDVVSTDPVEGGQVKDRAAGVVVRFNQVATPSGSGFTLFDARGARVAAAASSPDGGTTWRIRPARPLEAGRYGVRWRVLAGDAHPRTGTLTFSVAASPAARASTPAATPAPSEHPADHAAGSGHDGGATGHTDGGGDALLTALHAEPQGSLWAGVGVVARWLSFCGVLVAVGALVVVVTTLVGSQGDVGLSERLVRGAAAAAAGGALLEGVALLADAGGAVPWQPAAAVGLRLLAGASLVLCLRLLARGSGGRRSRDVPALPGGPSTGRRALRAGADGPSGLPVGAAGGAATLQLVLTPPVRAGRVRGVPTRPVAVATLSLLLLASFVLDGHTAIVGPRPLVAAAALAHTAAAAVWVGGVVLLAVLLLVRARAGVPTGAGELAVRFSVPATAAVVLAGVAGTCLAVQIIDGPGELVGTPWGRVLLAKLALVVVVALMGYANNRYALPALDAWRPGTARMLRRTVAAEAAVMVAVVLVTAVLVGAQS
jgi:copper transport protein